MTYKDAREKAIDQSEGCIQHVQAHLVRREDGDGFKVGGYSVSDWSCGATVTSFYDGMEQ